MQGYLQIERSHMFIKCLEHKVLRCIIAIIPHHALHR